MAILERLRRWAGATTMARDQPPQGSSLLRARLRKAAAAPDIAIGKLGLWIGSGSGEGWLDVALTIGDGHETELEAEGPLVQKSGIYVFERQLAELAAAGAGAATLWSEGGGLTVTVKRFDSRPGGSCEVALQRSIYSHRISFGFGAQDYDRALAGLRAVLRRFEREQRARRWMPAPERVFGGDAAVIAPARQVTGTIAPEDYPVEALARGEQGTVELAFTVTGDGELAGVSVEASSGSPRLDAAACLLAEERFRFDPARDAAGRPVTQRLKRKIIWQLAPEDAAKASPIRARRPQPGSPLQGADVSLRFKVDGVGWYAVSLQVGDKEHAFGGSACMTDAMGDLLRAGLELAAGARRAEIVCDAEPFLTRVEFERTLLNGDAAPEGWRPDHGCLIRVRELDHATGAPGEVEFEALCASPLAVAEAIYRMALPHFQEHEGRERAPFVALEATLAALRTVDVGA